MIKRTVLIVDDQSINREILGRLLEEKYQLMYAQNGREALEVLREYSQEISVVLLDIVMPIMDGYELLEIMKEDPVLNKIPVIVSTQMDDQETELRALSNGAQDYITKPYRGDIIRHRLENIIRFRETAAMINKVQRDELTGLYSKQFFCELVWDKIRNAEPRTYDMLCVGVERFKLINEVYGERTGDEVLRHIASVLLETCKTYQMCSRFQGDVFYALIPHVEERKNNVIRDMYQKVNAFPIDMNIKIHCGIFTIHNLKMSVGTICDRAKIAANENRGKYDSFFTLYDDSIRQRILVEEFITSNMQEAINAAQFQIYYQPKYALDTEQIAGAEALVRWIHPERGCLSPGTFIPIFEQNGFISKLDYYVWENVCRDLQQWLRQGNQPVAVSVNVSRIDLFNEKLPDIIWNLIEKYQIPQEYFHLEITESAYSENVDRFIEVVGRLREMGFVVEMDDFGSGYSSLNMLAEMPVDILKLDMRFMQGRKENSSRKGILGFVIDLAKWMNLKVIAEGVETKEQIDFLRKVGCDYVQGFYYARPMPKEEFEKMLLLSTIKGDEAQPATEWDHSKENNPQIGDGGR